MQLFDLPEELIIIIIKELDLQSLQSLYNTCTRMRNIVCMHGVIKECHMSMNVMATVNTLKLNFFKDISNHLIELNMCGVPDLFKTKVVPAFKKLKNLKTLDISYTNLNVLDFIEIYNVCPTLKDITLNFVFGQPGIEKISQETLLQCQLLFKHFENVHFIGSLNNLLVSKTVLSILRKSKLQNLKLSAVEVDNVHLTISEPQHSDCEIPPFDHFAVFLLNWKSTITYESINNFPVLSMIDFRIYEFFIINTLNMYVSSVYASPIFKEFFAENFNVPIECVTDYNRNILGNFALMIWNKETTQFDDVFFSKLKRRVIHYFPILFLSITPRPVSEKFDWFFTEPRDCSVMMHYLDPEAEIKKRRIGMPNLVLNYDDAFRDKKKVQLSLCFNTHITSAIALTTNCEYLRKLTFLSLTGPVTYSPEFFNVLFRCCDNLATLNVEAPTISPLAPQITRSVPLSRTLKNIRLTDKRLDFTTIFSSFSQCQTLENIYIIDHRLWEHCLTADPTILLQKCANLYSIFIEAPFSETAQVKQLQMFNKAKASCEKHHLKVVINQESIHSTFQYNYDPFVAVFKLNPIKPV